MSQHLVTQGLAGTGGEFVLLGLEPGGVGPVAPVANFTANPQSGIVPLTVSFTDLSTNSPTNWSWTFGDGGTSTAENPLHVYAATGSYTVTLTATNAAGSNSKTATAYIVVTLSHVIQHINLIIWQDEGLLAGLPDWPGSDFVYDPSSSGPPSTWPPFLHNPDGTPTNPPIPPFTRIPGGSDGTPPKRRKGGTGNPPGNWLTRLTPFPGPHACFVGEIKVQIMNPPPDFGGWNGTQLVLFGALCAPYNPPTVMGPTTGFVMRTIDATPLGLSPGTVPIGTLLPDCIAIFLSVNVGSNSTATVIGDQYDTTFTPCTPGSQQIGVPTCGGSITPSSPLGNSVGAVIHPA